MHCASKRTVCITFDNKLDLIYILLRDSELDKGENLPCARIVLVPKELLANSFLPVGRWM